MNPHQHKIFSAIIVSLITFFGFQALSIAAGIYQISTYFSIALYLAIFHIFWITFVFDLHLKHREPVNLASARYRHLITQAFRLRFKHFLSWHYLKHYLNYMILPAILFWAVVALVFLNPFRDTLKQTVIVASSFALTVAYWHMKEHVSSKLETRHNWLKILAAVKLYAAFLAYSALFGIVWYFGLSQNFLFYFVLGITFMLIYQALFSYGYHSAGLLGFTLFCSLLIGLIGLWIYSIWFVEYFTAALVLLALYNTLWGFIHHYLDRTLSLAVATEYIVLAVVVLSIVLASHNFGSRVI